MEFRVPSATRIAVSHLASVLFMPAVAGLIVAGCLTLSTPLDPGVGNWVVFAMGFVKLCYLGTAAAMAGRWIAEQSDGGPLIDAWWNGEEDQIHPMRRPEPEEFWHLFPNHLDGAVLALALVLAVHRLAA